MTDVQKMDSKAFPLPLIGRFVGKGEWEMLKPFQYNSKKYGVIKIPVGFLVNGASFPKAVYSIMGSPWGGKFAKPSVIHDFLYFKKTNRKRSDLVFLEGMKVCKVPYWKRKVMYYALRLFGFISFNNKK